MIQIDEVIRPADQGFSRPFICRGSDGFTYYVKGLNSGRQSQYREWVCAHVAVYLKLNVAPFCLVDVPENLVRALPPGLREIGWGAAFASRRVENASWLEPDQAQLVPQPAREGILLFDWLIANGDRNAGNSNLLWDARNSQVVVIDQNQAFSELVGMEEFARMHLFGSEMTPFLQDMFKPREYHEVLAHIPTVVDNALSLAPAIWAFCNSEGDQPTSYLVQEEVRLLKHRAATLFAPK